MWDRLCDGLERQGIIPARLDVRRRCYNQRRACILAVGYVGSDTSGRLPRWSRTLHFFALAENLC